MIEILIQYIQDKGYTVDVLPGRLFISKIVEEQIVGLWWAFSKLDLSYALEECLYFEATKRMDMIDKAIDEKVSEARA